jgi:hypothetical protein
VKHGIGRIRHERCGQPLGVEEVDLFEAEARATDGRERVDRALVTGCCELGSWLRTRTNKFIGAPAATPNLLVIFIHKLFDFSNMCFCRM